MSHLHIFSLLSRQCSGFGEIILKFEENKKFNLSQLDEYSFSLQMTRSMSPSMVGRGLSTTGAPTTRVMYFQQVGAPSPVTPSSPQDRSTTLEKPASSPT